MTAHFDYEAFKAANIDLYNDAPRAYYRAKTIANARHNVNEWAAESALAYKAIEILRDHNSTGLFKDTIVEYMAKQATYHACMVHAQQDYNYYVYVGVFDYEGREYK